MTALESHMYAASCMRPPFPDIQQPVPNLVFLFEMRQLFKDDDDDNDNNTACQANQFCQDMQDFLELDDPLVPMLVHQWPGRDWENDNVQSVKNGLKINICDDEHIPVWTDLMQIAQGSSMWICEYLLDSSLSATTAGGGGGGGGGGGMVVYIE